MTPLDLGPDGQRYYPGTNCPAAPWILHDRYAVIGPGEPGTALPAVTRISRNPDDEGKYQQVILNPNAVPQLQLKFSKNSAGSNECLTGASPAVAQAPAAVVINTPHRLSVSEPTDGYDSYKPSGASWNGVSVYSDQTQMYAPPYDTPFDRANELLTNGLTRAYRVAYLQRLANPFAAYDSVSNPYRTIDSMPIDLFACNGWEDPAVGKLADGSQGEPGPGGASRPPDGLQLLRSRERGDSPVAGTFPTSNIWNPEPLAGPLAASVPFLYTPGDPCFPSGQAQRPNLALQQTLGLLNKPFFAGSASGSPRNDLTEYLGDVPPDVPPFPWIAWNARPFASELELPLVPYASSSNLLKTFLPTGAIAAANPSFPYLLDFFTSASTTPPGPEFYRLLDLVGVPSPYVGTEIQGNPTTFADPRWQHSFHPPYNRIPNYREPGRVNLNTIASANVWQGLMNGFPDPTDATALQASLNTTVFSGGTPVNPFRSYAGQMFATSPPAYLAASEVNATLLRGHPTATDLPRSTPPPLFGFTRTTAPNAWTASAPVAGDWNDPDRNPFFRYQGMERLGNLVTTRSNVFAVWITVGYFQATASTVDAGHPDGYTLGAEIGRG